jgi:heterodisulfide reductase subunit A
MPPKFSREIDQPVVHGGPLKGQFRTSPCERDCPAGNSVQKLNALVAKGEFAEALRYLRAKNPFPGVTGRVCPHFCQGGCNRGKFDAPVSIRSLERAAGDHGRPQEAAAIKRRPGTGRTAAVVGSGPAGLSCAYFLALLGHSVTVFEAGPVLGGLPRVAVPSFRLPKDVVDREVGRILDLGVKALVNTRVGRDISFEKLQADFDALVVAAGTQRERALPLPNADKGLKAVEFLREVNLGRHRDMAGATVVVMGGGGVAFDCAFCAKRLGAAEVHVVCLEKCGEMLAPSDDLIQAAEEGVKIHNACTMSKVLLGDDHTVLGAEYFEVSACRFDQAGKVSIEPVPGSHRTLRADCVIFAVGTQTELDFMREAQPRLSPRGLLMVDQGSATSLAGVFAAGDVTDGPGSIARAIGSGRKAAFDVHAYLSGEQCPVFVLGEDGTIVPAPRLAGETAPHVVDIEELYGLYHYARRTPPEPGHDPQPSFFEREPGLSRETAMAEAEACFHCGHCKSCGTCVEDCPGYVLVQDSSGKPGVVYGEECWHCANCRTSCPCGAVGFEFPLRMLV